MTLIGKLEEVRGSLGDARRRFNELEVMDSRCSLPHMNEIRMKINEANFYLNDVHETLSAIIEKETTC